MNVSCVNYDVKVEMFDVYVLVFILNENKWYSLIVLFPYGWAQHFDGMGGEYYFYHIYLEW